MQIRTVTLFDTLACPAGRCPLSRAGRVGGDVKTALEDAGHDVQTVGCTLPPVARTANADGNQVVALARHLEAACAAHGIDYATIGPALPNPPEMFDAIPDALGAPLGCSAASDHQRSRRGGSAGRRPRRPGDLPCGAADTDGFGNLRFAALANVPPGVPFLPRHTTTARGRPSRSGWKPRNSRCGRAGRPDHWRTRAPASIRLIEGETAGILDVVVNRSSPPSCTGGRDDCSLAPLPDAARSIGTALEALTGGRVGERGTLAAVAFVADALDRATFRRVGYSGVFLPVFGRGAGGAGG